LHISKVAILGLGLIGGSIAKALRHSSNQYYISAYDINDAADKAISENVINYKLNDITSSLESDVIFICLPIDTALITFKELAPKLKEKQILTDVCSVKSAFSELWAGSKSKGLYIGGHPMTGKEKGGFENSDRLLFENSIYIVTEDLSKNDELKEFRKLIESLGSNILFVPAKQHDVIAASVSHLPQLVSVALVNTSALKTDNYNFLDLAAGGFRDMTRIASSEFNIWESIIVENKSEIVTAIDKFSFEISKIKKLVINNDFTALQNYFNEARQHREEIPKNTKGFLTPLHDIFVFVKDEPGMLSKITTELSHNGINILDIELLKIREGSGGNFRISFESKDAAGKAKVVLAGIGFRTS
jgi:prephenate dehydrogenase